MSISSERGAAELEKSNRDGGLDLRRERSKTGKTKVCGRPDSPRFQKLLVDVHENRRENVKALVR